MLRPYPHTNEFTNIIILLLCSVTLCTFLGKDSCDGDSGGPLMMIKRKRSELIWIQIGIVSFGRTSCGTRGVPGVYTKVSAYTQWILDHIGG